MIKRDLKKICKNLEELIFSVSINVRRYKDARYTKLHHKRRIIDLN